MFSEVSLPAPSQQTMMLRMVTLSGCYRSAYSAILRICRISVAWPYRDRDTSAALVYAINRCTSAESLEYVKSAS